MRELFSLEPPDDEIADWRLPVCSNCGLPIRDDFLFNIYGELFCEDCINDCFKEETEDYVEEG